MNYMKLSKISEELHDRIILVAYGSASFLEKRRIEKLASENESVQKLLDEYKSSANLVHSIPIEKYSGKLNGQIITNSSKSILDYIYQIIVGRPAISAIATILIISAITFSLFKNKEPNYGDFTFAEVERANFESKQALLIINKIFSETEELITNDILINEVSKPIKEGIKTVNKLFYKEKKNES